MAKKKKKQEELDFEKYRQTRIRHWEIKPITQVVPDKKKKDSRKACRSKVVTDE